MKNENGRRNHDILNPFFSFWVLKDEEDGGDAMKENGMICMHS